MLYFCPFLDQQLNLCRHWTNPGFFRTPGFCTLMDKSRVFQNHTFFQNHNPGVFQNPEFCMDKSRILHGQISNSAWTNPEFCMDKSQILHGQIPDFAWPNPRFCTLWGIPCYFKTSVFLKNSPFKVHFTIPYKNSVLFLKFPF